MHQVGYMKSSASESKPFQSRFTVEISGQARREERTPNLTDDFNVSDVKCVYYKNRTPLTGTHLCPTRPELTGNSPFFLQLISVRCIHPDF